MFFLCWAYLVELECLCLVECFPCGAQGGHISLGCDLFRPGGSVVSLFQLLMDKLFVVRYLRLILCWLFSLFYLAFWQRSQLPWLLVPD